jgi:hypothetical protein
LFLQNEPRFPDAGDPENPNDFGGLRSAGGVFGAEKFHKNPRKKPVILQKIATKSPKSRTNFQRPQNSGVILRDALGADRPNRSPRVRNSSTTGRTSHSVKLERKGR